MVSYASLKLGGWYENNIIEYYNIIFISFNPNYNKWTIRVVR